MFDPLTNKYKIVTVQLMYVPTSMIVIRKRLKDSHTSLSKRHYE